MSEDIAEPRKPRKPRKPQKPREPRNRDGLQIWKSDVRRAVKAIGLHRTEVDVCIAILNHYWGVNKSKNSARGLGHDVLPVYPGAAKIADKAKVHLKSALNALRLLRKLNIIKVVGFDKGGRGFSQRFLINFNEIFASKGIDPIELAALRPTQKAGNKGGNKGGNSAAIIADGLNSIIIEEKDSSRKVIDFSDHRKPLRERPL
jgi:hypothetical protein